MKKTELRKIIRSLLNEQRDGGVNPTGMAGRQIVKEIPLDGISEEDARELEQIINRDYPGGDIDIGGTDKKIKIRIRFKFWPPSITLYIDFI